MKNKCMLQGFEWYLPEDGQFWNHLAEKAESLKAAGIDMIWLPPAYKGAAGNKSVGYDVYDKYDLGEFDQKGSVATKYGTKEEYLACIRACKAAGLEVICDIVLNHMMGGDETQIIGAVQDSPEDRTQVIAKPKKIEAWMKFTFPGRHGTYSSDTYDFHDFNGTDYDARSGENALYRVAGKSWSKDTDWDFGNYDYLMGANLELRNPETARKVIDWGRWYLNVTEADGLRLDAVKHISHDFLPLWLKTMREQKGYDFFTVGEYWSGEVERLLHYLDAVDNSYSLFDVPLHFALQSASDSNGGYDMRRLMDTSLLKARPQNAVTFVDNHDTQPGQGLESFVKPWFKQQAYSLILFQELGLPCIFYGDLFGIPHDQIAPVEKLELMCRLRELAAYGTQMDYYDNESIVGYTRAGLAEVENSGLAVLVTNSSGGSKRMYVSMKFAGEEFYDALHPQEKPVKIGADGCGEFRVLDGAASVWIRKPLFEELIGVSVLPENMQEEHPENMQDEPAADCFINEKNPVAES